MKVAFFTPLNPIKSGISDFSEELLMELRKHIEIDLFLDNVVPTNKDIVNNFKIFQIEEFDDENIRKQYDQYIYHIGNNKDYHYKIGEYLIKYPGILELHDISLHHMLAEATVGKGDTKKYIQEMKYSHGHIGEKIAQQFINGEINAPWEDKSLQFTVNKRYVDAAKAIIVHSDFAKQMIKGISDKIVKTILLHTNDIEDNYEEIKLEARKKYNINKDEIVMASFGFATAPKRIVQIIEALNMLKDEGYCFKYYIVGQVDESLNLKEKIKNLKLEENVIITGFVDLNEFKDYMRICDICLNLRYPTQGESSASLHRVLGMGKVVFVSDVGSFKEYSDEIVVKINTGESEIEDIYKELVEFINKKDIMNARKKKSIEFAKKYCSLEKNAVRYKEFLEAVNNGSYYESNILENIMDKLCEVKIYDEYFIEIICRKLEVILVDNYEF